MRGRTISVSTQWDKTTTHRLAEEEPESHRFGDRVAI